MTTAYVLIRHRFSEPDELLGVYFSREKACDRRRGEWREVREGRWTTANPRWGSEFLHPVTDTARRFIYSVQAVPLKETP